MPTYEYECDACHRVFEVRQRITEAPLTACDACGGPVHRLLSPAPFILKGEGWYVTDYPSEARKKAMASEKPKADGAKADGPKSDSAKGDGAKSDGAKSDGAAKSDSSSTTSSTSSAAASSSASSKSD